MKAPHRYYGYLGERAHGRCETHAAGHAFYQAASDVWLTDHVPVKLAR